MAIADHSFGTEFIARAMVKKSGIDSLNSSIAAGMIPEERREKIKKFVEDSLTAHGGKVPGDLSLKTAQMIAPHSSLPVVSIRKILDATNFFGMVGPKPTVAQAGVTAPYDNQIKQQTEATRRFEKSVSAYSTPTVMTVEGTEVTTNGSSLDNMARAMTNAPIDDEVEIITPKQRTGGPAPYEIGSDDKQELNPGSNFVSSAEELDAEFTQVTRDISEIIVHFSETYQNANLSKDDIKKIAKEAKYHYIVHRDGSIERDVPLNASGKHTPENGHDGPSVGVCLVGGLTAASGEEAIGPEVDASAITRSQYLSLYHIFDAFYRHHPGGQALGHSEINPEMRDPGFDVRDYVWAKFSKISLYENPQKESALTKSDILEATANNTGVPILSKDPELEEKFQ